eukprot:6027813-Prymnesium_polylepis.1
MARLAAFINLDKARLHYAADVTDNLLGVTARCPRHTNDHRHRFGPHRLSRGPALHQQSQAIGCRKRWVGVRGIIMSKNCAPARVGISKRDQCYSIERCDIVRGENILCVRDRVRPRSCTAAFVSALATSSSRTPPPLSRNSVQASFTCRMCASRSSRKQQAMKCGSSSRRSSLASTRSRLAAFRAYAFPPTSTRYRSFSDRYISARPSCPLSSVLFVRPFTRTDSPTRRPQRWLSWIPVLGCQYRERVRVVVIRGRDSELGESVADIFGSQQSANLTQHREEARVAVVAIRIGNSPRGVELVYLLSQPDRGVEPTGKDRPSRSKHLARALWWRWLRRPEPAQEGARRDLVHAIAPGQRLASAAIAFRHSWERCCQRREAGERSYRVLCTSVTTLT